MGIADTLKTIAGLPADQRLAFVEAAIEEPHAGIQIAALRALADPNGLDRAASVVDRFADLLPEARAEVARAPDEFLRIAREKILSGRDPQRHGAYRLVADLGGHAAIELLKLGIGDESARVRDGVLHALERHLRAFLALHEQDCRGDGPAGQAFTAAHREAARGVFDGVLRAFAMHRQMAFVEVLVGMGEFALPLVLTTVLPQKDAELYRAFAKEVLEQSSRGAAALLFRMAMERNVAAQAMAQHVLRSRRDAAFGRAVAAHLATMRDDDQRAAVKAMRDIPWLPIVAPVSLHLEPAEAVAVVALIGECSLDAERRSQLVEAFVAHTAAEVRCKAIEVLQTLRCPSGFGAVERGLGDAVDAVRMAAAKVVIELEPRNKMALLTPLLGSASEELRRLAVREISKVSFTRYLQRYDQMDGRARQVAARALAKIDATMLERLTDEVTALDATRRLKALQIVEFIDAEQELRQPLLELLDDPDTRVRATAIRIVELTGSMEGMKLLIGALTDPDRRVRANAVEAFEQLEDRRYVQLLTPFLRDPDNRVRANTAKALWNLGWTEAREELQDMLVDQDESLRISAAWAIGEIGFPGARELLELRESIELSSKVRAKIRAAIAELGVTQGGVS